jgi:arsenate reductase
MAEGFARSYGSDVLEAVSAGLFPASTVARLSREVMSERNIDISNQYPKSLSEVNCADCDVIVNMSGMMLPFKTAARVLTWEIPDPIGADKEVFVEVAVTIERLVMNLILALRRGTSAKAGPK